MFPLTAEFVVDDLKLDRVSDTVHHRICNDDEREVGDEGKHVDSSYGKHTRKDRNDECNERKKEKRRDKEVAAEDTARIFRSGIVGPDRVNVPIDKGDNRLNDADNEKNSCENDNKCCDQHEPVDREEVWIRLEKEVEGIREKLGQTMRDPACTADSDGGDKCQNTHRKKRKVAEELQNVKFYEIGFVVLHKGDSSFFII